MAGVKDSTIRELQSRGIPLILASESNPRFERNTKPWSLAYDKKPKFVVIPESIEQLQSVVDIFRKSKPLDFAVRGRGCGSSSAADAIISLSASAFQHVEVISRDERDSVIVEVGAGTEWGDVDRKIEELAPEYVVVGARCPYVGVAGSTLTGGFSWLSHEFGISSDPHNMQDVQIVLPSGGLVWASEHDPELLWGLRGGGGNFGVVTKFRFCAKRYSQKPFSGLIFFPESSLHELSRAVAKFTNEMRDPKLAMHVFIIDSNPDLALHGASATPQLMALIFDGYGEGHGRSKEGFAWAFEVTGAREGEGANECREMTLREVHELQRSGQATHGVGCSWLQAALVGDSPEGFIDDEFLVRGWQWYEMMAKTQPDLAVGSFVLLEIMQTPAFTSGGGPDASAWPHGQQGRKHVLQLSTGTKPVSGSELSEVQERALALLNAAPAKISGKSEHPDGDFLPNFLLPNHDLSAIFGKNWGRLKRLKSKYDPDGAFDKGLGIARHSS